MPYDCSYAYSRQASAVFTVPFAVDAVVLMSNLLCGNQARHCLFLHSRLCSAQVWWPQQDAELFTAELWTREYSFTWDFSRDMLANVVVATA